MFVTKEVMDWIKKELILKLDFVTGEFVVGYIWVAYFISQAFLTIPNLISFFL